MKLAKKNLKCVLMGGMKGEEFHELSKRYTECLEDLIIYPEKIERTPYNIWRKY